MEEEGGARDGRPRAARSVKGTIEIEANLRACGVSVVFVREGIDTSTPIGEFFRNVMSSIAEFEGHLIHERMFKGLRVKASQGGYTGTWLPYGYMAVDGQVVVIEEEAAVIRRIFGWRASGRSLRWMARKLNVDGAPMQHRKRWYPSTVWDLYRNRFYTGRSKFDGTWVEGQHWAIVSDEVFHRATAGNGGNRRSGRTGRRRGCRV